LPPKFAGILIDRSRLRRSVVGQDDKRIARVLSPTATRRAVVQRNPDILNLRRAVYVVDGLFFQKGEYLECPAQALLGRRVRGALTFRGIGLGEGVLKVILNLRPNYVTA